jgi:hypothetical protein
MTDRTETLRAQLKVADTIREQITTGVLMSCGARDFALLARGLSFRVGPAGKLCKVLVELNGNDLYDVRYVSLNRRTYAVTCDERIGGVSAASLAGVVCGLGDRKRY